jgi:DNA segregation ATPase FtsK/SpoIIIE-like protein
MRVIRAARLIDQLEANGIVAPSDGTSEPRKVLPKKDEAEH